MRALRWLRRRGRPGLAPLAAAAAAAPRIPRGLTPGSHLALDSAGSQIYWARARAGRGGLHLQAWGQLPWPAGREEAGALRSLARARGARWARIEVALRSPGLKHRRLELPPLAGREAAAVAQRRLQEFLTEQGEESVGSAIWQLGAQGCALWLVSAPAGSPPVFEQRWRGLGFELHRLSSEALALGNLGRLLPPLPEGEVSAILDVHSDGADCVICDGRGWLFNRVIALQRAATGGESEDARALEGRIVTELRRTLQYAQQELRLGKVARLVLSGSHPQLEVFASGLRGALELPVDPIGSWIQSGPARGLAPAAARAVGLALAVRAEGANLLPPAALEARQQRVARRRALLALAASAALALGAGARSVLRAEQLERQVEALGAQLQASAAEQRVLQTTALARERAGSLAALLEQLRPPQPALASWLEALRRLAPPDVALATYQAQREAEHWQGVLQVEARADSVSVAAERAAAFADSLTPLALFHAKSVERTLEPAEAPAEGASQSVRFRISGPLAPIAFAPSAADASAPNTAQPVHP